MICSAELFNIEAMEHDLDTPAGRLRWAREQKFKEAGLFADAIGVKKVTYRSYESGQNGFSKHVPAFAKKLGVDPAWLAHGIGTPRGIADDGGPQISARLLGRLLYSLGPSIPKGDLSESASEALAVALIHGIELLPSAQANDASDDLIGMAARAAAIRFREALNT